MMRLRACLLGGMLTIINAACGGPAPAADAPAAAPAAVPAPAPALPPPSTPVTSAEATTDERGRFQFRGLAAGAYRVTFGDPGDAAFTQIDGVQVNANYGANLVDLRVGSAEPSSTLGSEYQPNRLPFVIRGNVVDVRGAPIANVRVRAARQ